MTREFSITPEILNKTSNPTVFVHFKFQDFETTFKSLLMPFKYKKINGRIEITF